MKLVKCLITLLLVQPAWAIEQDTRPFEFSKLDQQLNQVYQQVIQQLPVLEQDKLKKAQRTWIAFRDLDCQWAFGAEPLDCMIDRTHSRVKELEQTMFFNISGEYRRIGHK